MVYGNRNFDRRNVYTIVHQLNFAIVCFVYELVLSVAWYLHYYMCMCSYTAKGVRTLRRVSDYSKGCQNYFMALQRALVNASQKLMNTLVSMNTPSSNLTPHF